MKKILQKALSLEFLTSDEANYLYLNAPLAQLMAVAAAVRDKIHPNKVVTWQIDRNVNITNVCVSGCKFCNFHCRRHQRDRAYITTPEQYRQKIDQMIALGGDQLLLQGGMHPELGIEYYEELFTALKSEYPSLRLNALGPPEIFYLSRRAKISIESTLERLRAAGLDTLPGAGAEILDNDIRRQISPGKCSADEWLEVMRVAQNMGIRTTATMMYGHIEESSHRIAHLLKLRDLQSETGGFLAFIPWPFQGRGTELEAQGVIGESNMVEYLRLIAISRIILTNIPNIQASWLTVGVAAGQMALHGGANDLGSIMIEENVVSAAGSNNTLDAVRMQETIRDAGFTPRLRNQLYEFRD